LAETAETPSKVPDNLVYEIAEPSRDEKTGRSIRLQERRERLALQAKLEEEQQDLAEAEERFQDFNLYESREELLALSTKMSKEGLTPEEEARYKNLRDSGFDWTSEQFNRFKKAVLKHGRDNFPAIAELVQVSEAEVKAYSKRFWPQITQITQTKRFLEKLKR
jgi:hypothetical protein